MKQTDVLELSKALVAIRSVDGDFLALSQALDLCIAELKGFTIEEFESNGYRSILVYKAAQRPRKFKVILNGHLDVVPGKEEQYTPVVKDNRLYGVGALDMKSSVACLISTFKQMAPVVDYPLGLQLVTDEEVGGFHGTKYQVEQGVRSEFVIAGETTQFDIVNKAKGVLWLKISSKGKTAHGAYPWRGVNAIWKMTEFLEALRSSYPVPTEQVWQTTVNLSRIETSNKSFNKIPDDASVYLDIRFVHEDRDTVLKEIKAMVPKGFKLEVVTHEPAQFVPEDNHFLQALQKSARQVTGRKVKFYGAQGSSDARHFARVDNAGVEFGLVGKGIGSDSEWIDINSFPTYVSILSEFLRSV